MKSNINKLILIEVIAGILLAFIASNPAYDSSTTDYVLTI